LHFFRNIVLICSFSVLLPQTDSIISYELKIGNGKGESRDFFENLIDINTFFDNGLYLYTQLEYSVPPLLGPSSDIKNILNTMYAQYSSNNYELTLGNLYLLQGMGLSMHTFQNQDIDYDNSIYGFDINYSLNNNFDIFSTVGYNNVKSRTNPAEINPSISVQNNVGLIGSKYFHDNFELYYLTMVYDQFYDSSDMISLMNLSNDLGDHLDVLSDYILNENPDFEMKNLEHNFGLNLMFGPFDIYFEKSLVFYDKILSERTDGYKNYISIYANILGYDLIYEFKDYNTTLLYNVFSNPPVVFKEPSSVLIGRNLHTIDFSNEYGHQLNLNKIFRNNLSFNLSYAFALHHRNGHEDENLFNINIYNNLEELESIYPFKQYFIEFSNWSKNDIFYFRVGYDYYYETTFEKTIEAKTFPMQFVYKFPKGNSLTTYLELQEKFDKAVDKKYDYVYLSPSYNHFGNWSLTFFVDADLNGDDAYALDYTINIENAQLSLFLGSQKGGLVCANGSCIQQPDFDNGLKVTLRTSF